MKKYKFIVKKIIENDIELKAENYKGALAELLSLLAVADKEIFEKSEEKVINYDIVLDEIISKNDMENVKSIKEIIEKMIENNNNFEEKSLVEIEENDDENDAEYTEIVCEKCGNCIRVDDDLMS